MSLYSNLTWSVQVEKLLPPVLRDLGFSEVADDFKTGEADNQYIGHIVESSVGHYKEFPTLGVGIFKYLNGTASAAQIERDIRIQLKSDVFTNPLVNAKNFPEIVVNRIIIKVNG